jgi:hypothetical protein
MKHYDTNTDLVVGAGIQPPWPGALYNKPVVIHSHAHHGALRRSYLPEKTLDGFSGHYCGMGSTDSFGMPLQGFDFASVSPTKIAVGVGVAALALYFVMKR